MQADKVGASMWDFIMIWQAIGWLVLILCSPWIVVVCRKISRYVAYAAFPKDTILQYTDEAKIVEAYYIRHSLLRRPSFRKLSNSELAELEGRS